MPETNAVKNGARSDHPPPVVNGTVHSNMSQNINGIAHDEYHPGTFLTDYVIDDATNDGGVLLEEAGDGFHPGAARYRLRLRLPARPRSRMVYPRESKRWQKCLSVEQVENLPLCQVVILVNDRNLFGQAALSECVAECRRHSTCSNDNHFATFHQCIVVCCHGNAC